MKITAKSVDVAAANTLPAGSMQAFDVEGKKVLLANVDGMIYAINAICTHAGGDLSKGKLEGKIVTCPRHHSTFDVTTGKCISGPKIGFLKLKAKDETVFEAKVEGGRIKVSI